MQVDQIQKDSKSTDATECGKATVHTEVVRNDYGIWNCWYGMADKTVHFESGWRELEVSNLLMSLPVKELWKSIKILHSYYRVFAVFLFRTQ